MKFQLAELRICEKNEGQTSYKKISKFLVEKLYIFSFTIKEKFHRKCVFTSFGTFRVDLKKEAKKVKVGAIR